MHRVIRLERENGRRGGTAKTTEAEMAARIPGQRARTNWRSDILFGLLTAGPWIVLVWLLWPRG
jgi:hypothetical protein